METPSATDRAPAEIPGYTYGRAEVAVSPASIDELHQLMVTVGLTADCMQDLQLAGSVLKGQTRAIVSQWRSGIIAAIPHLARHSKSPDGSPLPHYLATSNLRFEQWILDTCLRPYDQDWLNYQHEIALRHTRLKKNLVDHVQSTPYVPLRDVTAFVAVMNETLRPYLAAKGHAADEVERMHRAWCKSIQLQLALWGKTYSDQAATANQW